jgi:large subunit ribosomal protein L5
MKMREINIEKVTLNIGCGGDQEKIERAIKLLKMLTNRKPVITYSKRRSTFGIPKGKPVGVKVTLRGSQAVDFLKLALAAKENTLKSKQIVDGTFSIGIPEYIDFPNVKYSHEIGMLGLDVCVTLARPGYRISKRRI